MLAIYFQFEYQFLLKPYLFTLSSQLVHIQQFIVTRYPLMHAAYRTDQYCLFLVCPQLSASLTVVTYLMPSFQAHGERISVLFSSFCRMRFCILFCIFYLIYHSGVHDWEY